jgi:hypothetical protein
MNLLEKLREAGLTDDEIFQSFQFECSNVNVQNKNRKFTFGYKDNKNFDWAIIHYSKSGKIYKIINGRLLSSLQAQAEFIKTAICNTHGEHGYSINQRIIFSQKPLEGKFIWNDVFRIRPILNTSKIGKNLAWGINIETGILEETDRNLGPPYPIIIEVRTKNSPNNLINANRIFKSLDNYQWLICCILQPLIGVPSSITNQPKWIILQNNSEVQYHLAYEGFNSNETDINKGENFTEIDLPDAPTYVGEIDYYNSLWQNCNQVELPDKIKKYFFHYDNLVEEKKLKFNRALYWFNAGLTISNHWESAIIAFVVSIECLQENHSTEICPNCNRPKSSGPTKKFNEFMEKYLEIPDTLKDIVKRIYSDRSRIVHGRYAKAADEAFFSSSTFSNEVFVVQSFVRRALINWLVNGNS